ASSFSVTPAWTPTLLVEYAVSLKEYLSDKGASPQLRIGWPTTRAGRKVSVGLWASSSSGSNEQRPAPPSRHRSHRTCSCVFVSASGTVRIVAGGSGSRMVG